MLLAQMAQFPAGFQSGGSLPGFSPAAAAAANFSNFRPQYSVPGQPASSGSSNVSRLSFVSVYRCCLNGFS